MATRASLRASDADRDRVAERLHTATTEGRLLAHELEERLARALRARTYGELDDLVDDLPGAPVAMVSTRQSQENLVTRFPLGIAVLGAVAGMVVMLTVTMVFAIIAAGMWLAPVIGICVLSSKDRRGRGRHSDSYYSRRHSGGWHLDAHSHNRRNQF